MNSSILTIKNSGFNVLDCEETQDINGGAILVGYAIALAAVALVGAVVGKDLMNVYNKNYERGYREEEYKYRTK
jgi:lactobin A/cerein 7B family class IIb bacteriocin